MKPPAVPIAFGRRLRLAAASAVLTVLAWLWLAVSFTAREEAWWNSIYLFVAAFAASTVLASFDIRSTLGRAPLLVALASLGFVSVFAF
jgi:hypothetical protein